MPHCDIVALKHNVFHPNQQEQLLIRSTNQAWSVFAEAYSAEARVFVVHVPKFSLPAFLGWKLNFEDPTQLITAPLIPAPSLFSPISNGEVMPVASALVSPGATLPEGADSTGEVTDS